MSKPDDDSGLVAASAAVIRTAWERTPHARKTVTPVGLALRAMWEDGYLCARRDANVAVHPETVPDVVFPAPGSAACDNVWLGLQPTVNADLSLLEEAVDSLESRLQTACGAVGRCRSCEANVKRLAEYRAALSRISEELGRQQ
jgi:hypothetical protein